MKIALYIKELILKNECIILPGFGGFDTHYQNAVFDNNTGKLKPPSKQVVFREDYIKDNSTLLNYISFKEKISINETKVILDEYISELNKKLEKENRVEIKDVGTLIRQIDGKIFFKPLASENYLIDSFGLSELNLPEQKQDIHSVIEKKDTKVIHKKKRSAILLPLLIIFIVSFLVIISLKLRVFEKIAEFLKTEKQNTNIANEKTVFGKMKYLKTDSIDANLEKQIDEQTSLQKALQYTEKKHITTTAPITNRENSNIPNRKYLIISGSFMKESYAIKQVEKLKQIGINPYIAKTKKGFFRVILNSYSDEKLAEKELERYRNLLRQNVWILADC